MKRGADLLQLSWNEDLTAAFDEEVSRLGLIILVLLDERAFLGADVGEILAAVQRRGYTNATRDMIEIALGELVDGDLIDQGPPAEYN